MARRWRSIFRKLRVGIAEYAEGLTDAPCSLDEPAELLVDVRGARLYAVGDFGITDAICLTGGSVYGIEAVAGVNQAILESRGGNVQWDALASAAGAVIYDFGGRDNYIHPDAEPGYAAWHAASVRVSIGAQGAGRSWHRRERISLRPGGAIGSGAAIRQPGRRGCGSPCGRNLRWARSTIAPGKVVCGHSEPGDHGEREPLRSRPWRQHW
ncbi:MAG: hypothetical protein R2848_11670 [Thermomicrobiales bacterium]